MIVIKQESLARYKNKGIQITSININCQELLSMLEYQKDYSKLNFGIYPYIYVTTKGIIRDITDSGNKVNFLCMLDELSEFPFYGIVGFGLNSTIYEFHYI